MATDHGAAQIHLQNLKAKWSDRMRPYRNDVLSLRSILLWDHKPAVVIVSILLFSSIYIADYFLTHSTVVSLILFASAHSLFLPLFLRKLLLGIYSPHPRDEQHFDQILELLIFAELQYQSLKGKIEAARRENPNFYGLLFVCLILASAIFNKVSGFYLSLLLSFSTIYAPGIIYHQVIPTTVRLTAHHWEHTLKPQLISLADQLANHSVAQPQDTLSTPSPTSISPSTTPLDSQPVTPASILLNTPVTRPFDHLPRPYYPSQDQPEQQQPFHTQSPYHMPTPVAIDPEYYNQHLQPSIIPPPHALHPHPLPNSPEFEIDPSVWASLTPAEQAMILESFNR